MAPLSADSLVSLQDVPPNYDACADSGTEDDAEHHGGPLARTVRGLGERETIRIIHHADRPPHDRFEVPVERVAVQPCRVRVHHDTRRGRQGPGDAHADRAEPRVAGRGTRLLLEE